MHHLKQKNSSGCKVTWPVFTWNPALLGLHSVIFGPRLPLKAALLLFGIRTNSLCSSCKVFFLYDTSRNLCMIVCVEYFKVCCVLYTVCVGVCPEFPAAYPCMCAGLSTCLCQSWGSARSVDLAWLGRKANCHWKESRSGCLTTDSESYYCFCRWKQKLQLACLIQWFQCFLFLIYTLMTNWFDP